MSYTIVYDRQFLRLPEGIVPLVLSGSNNCYEPMPGGRERRERDWCVFFNAPVISEKELMDRTESCCGGSYQEHFKRGGKWVDDAGFRRFMQQGIHTARSLEEILAKRPVHFICALHIWPKKYNDDEKTELRQYVHTSQELSEWIAIAQKRAAQCDESEVAYYHMAFTQREPLGIPRPIIHHEPVIAQCGKDYFISASNERMKTSRNPDEAHVFANTEAARAEIPPYWLPRLRFVKASTLQGRYCLRIENAGHAGEYVKCLSRSRMHMTMHAASAHRFPTHHAAEQYAKKLTSRMSHVGMTFSVCEIPNQRKEDAS